MLQHIVHIRSYKRKLRRQRKALELAHQEHEEARRLWEEQLQEAKETKEAERKATEDAQVAMKAQAAAYEGRLVDVNGCNERWKSRSQRYEKFLDVVIQDDVLSPIKDGYAKAKMIEKLKGKASAAGCKIQSLFSRGSSK